MKLSSFSTHLKDVFANMTRNRLMTIATIITLSAGLFLFGLTSALTLNVFSITAKLQTDFKLEAYIDESYDMAEKGKLEKKLKAVPNVTAIEFVSKEDAFEEFKKDFPQPELLVGIDDGTILRDTYRITLDDLALSKETVAALEKVPGVAKVSQLATEMQTFLNAIKKLQLATIVISIILGLLAVLVITNTINMSIYERREQIEIMKYVGATSAYIKVPFVLEGIFIGLISAVFSYFAVYYLYAACLGTVGSYAENVGIISKNSAALPLGFIIGGMGAILGCTGSIISIRKHLKEEL